MVGEAVPELGEARHLPAGYEAGWTFTAPVVEMPVYLDWLVGRVDELGGTLTRMALPALPGHAEVVVDAAGLGGRLLGEDPTVVPVRGQVVLVEQVGLDQWWLDSTVPTYVVPRSRDIVVGGTEDEEVWDRAPDEATASQILDRARALVPQLRGREDHRSPGGVPSGPPVGAAGGHRHRRPGRRVVHCYGHGGAGVTLSWGCADEVADLVATP